MRENGDCCSSCNNPVVAGTSYNKIKVSSRTRSIRVKDNLIGVSAIRCVCVSNKGAIRCEEQQDRKSIKLKGSGFWELE